MHGGFLDREHLRAAHGVKHFKDTLMPHFIKGAQSVFFWRFFFLMNSLEQEEETWKRSSGSASYSKETLLGFLDGHVADVRLECRTETND